MIMKTCGQCRFDSTEYDLEDKQRCPFCGNRLIVDDMRSLI